MKQNSHPCAALVRRMLMALLCLTIATIVLQAQDKLSVTTQIFLNEQRNQALAPKASQQNRFKLKSTSGHTFDDEQIIATPDTIDGKAYISAFIRIDDQSAIKELESLGVIMQCQFKNATLLTTLIPVEKIEAVADIATVSRINVASKMQTFTDAAREVSNVDDVLTYSTDARSAGLPNAYDGTGVLLGVIDTGIDFQHIAFKDKNGNSRIKRAYVYNGSTDREYTSVTSSSPTTDNSSADHGTHTSSTAGGSSVVINGSSVTVTDNHASATYGGMAPGTDLYLAGLNALYDTYISNAFQYITNYAGTQPLVVSNSWGSQIGPHDGTGDYADIVSEYFDDNHPNRVCLFAASNDAGKSKVGSAGGYYVSGTATSASPLGTIINSAYIDADPGFQYAGVLASAWARGTSSLACKILVLNSSTGALVKEISVTPTTNGATPSGLSTYYSGTLYVYKDYIASENKTQVLLRAPNYINSKSYSTTTVDGSTYYKSNYILAIQIYPTNGSSTIDIWRGGSGYLSNHLSTNGYTWSAGSDNMSVSDEATIPGAISVGAYVTKNNVADYNGTSHDYSDTYTMGDIAYFSSYTTQGSGPLGEQYPWITAPGARLVAAVNHYSSTYTSGSSATDRVNANTTSPYGAMQGTSMATPTAAGIVALWLQVAKENDLELTTSDIKTIMKESAIHDSYTDTGTNHTHFGQGKIDALAGIQYILSHWCNKPTITASPTTLTFEQQVGTTASQTVSIGGMNLEGNITATLSDASGVYTIDKTTITANQATEGTTITITYAPTLAGTHNATLTLSSSNASDVTININGTAAGPMLMVNPTSLTMAANVSATATKTFAVTGTYITGDVALTLTDDAGVFSISPATIPASQINATTPVNVIVTFQAEEEGEFAGMVTLTSEGVAQQTVALNATASNGGTASDTYLDITKYATIDQAGWNKNYVDQLYQYTEYDDQDVAWLTLPVYGAWSSIYYSPKAQNWISSNYSSSPSTSTMGVVTNGWGNANDIYQGSSAYFTTTTARYFGNQSEKAQSSSNRTITFYVTNVTAVKLYGLNGPNSAGSYTHYPTTLTVTEVTVGDNNDITDGAVVYNTSNYTNDATINFAATGLDKNKIYKVVAGATRGYLYEIGFQTTIERKSLAQVVAEGKLGKTYYLQQGDLQPVAISPDGKSLYCKDNGAYASPSQPAAGQIDYVSTVAGLQQGGWDQSNWVALQKADQSEWSSNELIGSGYTLKNVKGHLIDRVNPVLVLDKLPEAKEQRTAFTPNAMVACNFAGSEQLSPVDGKTYWFLTPKPMEVVEIHWAMWNEASGMFVAPPSIGSVNVANLSGQFEVNTSNLDFDFNPTDGDVYTFQAVIHAATPTAHSPRGNRAETARGQYVAYPVSELTWEGGIDDGIITGVQRLHGDKAFEVGRYNVAGQRVPADYHGVVIIRMSDGTARKVVQ